jgi:hypothetical protein
MISIPSYLVHDFVPSAHHHLDSLKQGYPQIIIRFMKAVSMKKPNHLLEILHKIWLVVSTPLKNMKVNWEG